MKRPAYKTVIFLLLGAILNIAVACGGRVRHCIALDNALKAPSESWAWRTSTVLDPSRAERLKIDMRLPTRAGWPLSCLEAFRFEYDSDGDPVRISRSWDAGIELPIGGFGLERQSVLLPVRPQWPGFAVNTILYAAIVWMFFAASIALRRRRRIKRGLCPGCAYPVGENDVCTECGAAVEANA